MSGHDNFCVSPHRKSLLKSRAYLWIPRVSSTGPNTAGRSPFPTCFLLLTSLQKQMWAGCVQWIPWPLTQVTKVNWVVSLPYCPIGSISFLQKWSMNLFRVMWSVFIPPWDQWYLHLRTLLIRLLPRLRMEFWQFVFIILSYYAPKMVPC